MKIPAQLAILKTFRRRLTNLSSRNRSLLLTSLPGGQFLDLHETDFLLNKPSFSLIADLISRKASINLCDVLDPRQERSNEVSRKLRRIDRTARFIEEERGTEDLYVGWPFVKGKFLDDTVIHGPLLFFPVQIEHQEKFWKLRRRGDELAFLNPTLALAYGQFNQVKLPDEVVDKSMDDFDRDALAFRTQLYEWLKSTDLEINFNPDLFTDKLHFFNKQTAKDLAQLERTGELKLYPEAVLGIFPQAGSFLVPDYDALIEKGEVAEEEEGTLLGSPAFTTGFLPEKNIHTPLPMDASQEAAVRAVKAGQSVVVQGPPGTGKSQLIANLMADAAASGKRVLLVCQKRAALDVVQERLRQVGMAPFLALIHDFQDDRRALYAQIASQINQLESYRQQDNSLNTVLLERDFDVESRRIDEVVYELQAFKKALFDTSECGLSAKELYLSTGPENLVIPLEDLYQQFDLNTIDGFLGRLSDYAAYRQRLGTNHSWSERVNFAAFINADLSKIDQTIARWIERSKVVNEQLMLLLGKPLSLAQLFNWQAHDWAIKSVLTLLDASEKDSLDPTRVWFLINQLLKTTGHPIFTTDENRLAQLIDTWQQVLAAPGPETSLAKADLRAFRDVLTDALLNRASWVRWNWWQLTNAGKAQLLQVATANDLSLSEVDLQLLLTKVNQRISLEAILYEVQPLMADFLLEELPVSLRLLRRAKQLTERINDLEPLLQLPAAVWHSYETFVERVSTVLQTAISVSQQQAEANAYLTTEQLTLTWHDHDFASKLRQGLRNDFDLLVEADRLQEGFSEGEKEFVDRLAHQAPVIWPDVAKKSLHRAWLNHLENLHPELRSVSTLKMAQWEQQLQESVQRKQLLSRDILLVKLREQTYRNLTFNRLNNVVTYRDLLHQATKKRNVWPVRKLMESYADEVFKLVPCWLASPESVSAMFPLREGLFDLVIFDEASQCFAENGIPAITRGNQVVITGDNQQLRPSDLYRTRLDDIEPDEEMPIALEAESLLELAAQYLPQLPLTEHYRSHSLDLITFSNEHFYHNKLSLLPHFDEINRHEPAIRYLNVKGTWQQNTNPVEAEAILQLLSQLTEELPGRSVGIVTFNYPQQQLIHDMLESSLETTSSAGEKAYALPPNLFVKNIENVQGDERDVIVFSVGYAPDERGRLAMQFGSLNARGGENRLNVAVTRARERIYVVTSLWPEQLNVADTANEGPRLLKAYLSYALNVAQQKFQPLPKPYQKLPVSSLLKNKLAEIHPDWRPELPFADLTVGSDGNYESLILTDDDMYYQQLPKQAHAYLPLALQARKWPYIRMWSREFWRKAGIPGDQD